MKGELRDWEPVRKGARYCAPACGRGCTWDEYQFALNAGRRLCKALNKGLPGDLFAVRVHENMGWFYAAEHEGLRVTASHAQFTHGKITGYTAWLETPGTANGGVYRLGNRTARADTPKAAVEAVLKVLALEIKELTTTLEPLATWLGHQGLLPRHGSGGGQPSASDMGMMRA